MTDTIPVPAPDAVPSMLDNANMEQSILNDMATRNGKPKRIAQAWLNISIPLAGGDTLKLPVGIPLHSDNRKESALIEAMRADPDKILELIGTVVFTDGTNVQEPLVIKL